MDTRNINRRMNTHGFVLVWCVLSVYAHLDDKNSQEKTMENLKIMEEEYGLKPLPVFHVSSKNWDLLEKCSKYDYIALGR